MFHRGTVRGGNNSWALLHLEARFPHLASEEEAGAFSEGLAAKLGLSLGFAPNGSNVYEILPYGGDAVLFRLVSRRHFTLLPVFIRECLKAGGQLSVLIYDHETEIKNSRVSMEEDPAGFWREIAMAQAYRK